jgi:hypothetical protein
LSGVVLNLLTSSGPTFRADHTVIDMGRHRLSIGTIKRGIRLPSNKKPRALPRKAKLDRLLSRHVDGIFMADYEQGASKTGDFR